MAVTFTEDLTSPIKTFLLASAGAAEDGNSSEFRLPPKRNGGGPLVVMTEDFATGTIAVHIGLVSGSLVEFGTNLTAAGEIDLTNAPNCALCQLVATDVDVTGDVEINIG
jgi:hypothetical protein